jgi:hypothetical protein
MTTVDSSFVMGSAMPNMPAAMAEVQAFTGCFQFITEQLIIGAIEPKALSERWVARSYTATGC